MRTIALKDCGPVAVNSNEDQRGCLAEIYRESWPGAFKTVQWNMCASKAGVMRGVHVHVDYDEFYTLPKGRVFIALKDIRQDSPTFGEHAAFEWSASDGFAIPVPAGVAHAVYFLEGSLLVFGLSAYWSAELDVMGCHWSELEPAIAWPGGSPELSCRDTTSGTFLEMVEQYDRMRRLLAARQPSTRAE